MDLYVFEVLERVQKAKKKEDKLKILKTNESWALKDIIRGSIDTTVVWNLPKGKPPYKAALEQSHPTNLLRENVKFKYFVKGGQGDKLPAININYCYHVISEQTNGASIFRGIYETDSDKDAIKIIAWFAGLGLPKDRIDSLKKESKEKEAIIAEKEKSRMASMKLDLDNDKVNSVTEEVNRKIKKKRSGFNKLQRGSRSSRPSIIDRRKRR